MRKDSLPISARVEFIGTHNTPEGDYFEFLVIGTDVLPSGGASHNFHETLYARVNGWKSHDEVSHLRVLAGFKVSDIFGFSAPLALKAESAPGKDLEVEELEIYLQPGGGKASEVSRRTFCLAALGRFLYAELLGFRVPSPFGAGTIVLRD